MRELRNVVERAVAFSRDDEIGEQDLPERIRATSPPPSARPVTAMTAAAQEALLLQGGELPTMEQLQRRYARLVLERVNGNKQRAAALLDIGRRTLYRWLGE